jgi:transposase-like protein
LGKLSTYFKYPEAIRKLIYTTNTIEDYHRQIRKVTKTKGAFTSERYSFTKINLFSHSKHPKKMDYAFSKLEYNRIAIKHHFW